MVKQPAKKYTFYRFRFLIGYSLLALAVIALLGLAVAYVPGGTSEAERTSALSSASIDLSQPASLLISDAPYHVLQKTSIELFGLSSISIKLPSALIAFLTSVGLVLLLRRWFSARVSVITGAVAVTCTPFIFLAQQGTPAIMTLFWPVVILLLANLSIRAGKLQYTAVPLLGIVAALSLYTPLSAVTLVALAVGGLLHPHVRYVMRRKLPRPLAILAILLGILVLLPLLYMIYRTPLLAGSIIAVDNTQSLNLIENLRIVLLQLGDVTGKSSTLTAVMAPFFAAPIGLIILVGAYRLIRHGKHTAQNYILMTWLLLLVPAILLNPSRPDVLFVPLIILFGVGMSFLLHYWYGLFPNNPYARLFGLLPLTVLIGGIMLNGSLRYFYSYHYSAPLVTTTSRDLSLVREEVEKAPKTSTPILAVAESEHAIYELLASSHNLSVDVVTSQKVATERAKKNNSLVIATRASDLVKSDAQPARITATGQSQQSSDRLYIYKNIEK